MSELQKDMFFRREISKEGVDGEKYSLGQIRVLQKIKEKAIEYKNAGVAGAAIGAVAGTPLFGIGAVPGAIVGFFAGVGIRAYGAPADAIDAQLTRFEGDLEEESNR